MVSAPAFVSRSCDPGEIIGTLPDGSTASYASILEALLYDGGNPFKLTLKHCKEPWQAEFYVTGLESNLPAPRQDAQEGNYHVYGSTEPLRGVGRNVFAEFFGHEIVLVGYRK